MTAYNKEESFRCTCGSGAALVEVDMTAQAEPALLAICFVHRAVWWLLKPGAGDTIDGITQHMAKIPDDDDDLPCQVQLHLGWSYWRGESN